MDEITNPVIGEQSGVFLADPEPIFPRWKAASEAPKAAKSLMDWLESQEEPTQEQLIAVLASALAKSGKDFWELGEDVMPPLIPSAVVEWIEQAPPWPAYRPAREAWLAACVFSLRAESGSWKIGDKSIQANWVRDFVSRFLQIAGLLDPADKNSIKVLNATITELNRLPWPEDKAAAFTDPIAGWIRNILIGSPMTYVATSEIFTVWQAENPEDLTSIKEFGKRLKSVIEAWKISNGSKGAITQVENIQESCCQKFTRDKRARGWAGLTLTPRAIAIWKNKKSGGMEA